MIVESAAEARENDHEQKLKQKDNERGKNMVELAVLCADLDTDESGTVSMQEMQRGYDTIPDFKRLMDQMDIKRDEMELIFNVLDSDGSGNVSYLEFCKNLGSFFKRDPIIMHSLVQCSIMDLKKVVQTEVVPGRQIQGFQFERCRWPPSCLQPTLRIGVVMPNVSLRLQRWRSTT